MRASRWPSVLVTFALLVAGLTNAHAHVHLCFDGQEAPAALHVAEHGDHLGHEPTDGEHDDVDVDVPARALAKAFKYDVCALLSPPAIVSFYERGTGVQIVAPAVPPPPQPAAFLRPPLRAPPR